MMWDNICPPSDPRRGIWLCGWVGDLPQDPGLDWNGPPWGPVWDRGPGREKFLLGKHKAEAGPVTVPGHQSERRLSAGLSGSRG